MTYLSRIALNPRSRQAQGDLQNCQQMHSRILSAFPETVGTGRSENRVLFRVEGAASMPRVIVQSCTAPDWTVLPSGYLMSPPECKSVDRAYNSVAVGQRLAFRLRANPTKRLPPAESGEGKEKKRIGKRVELFRPVDQINWLRRKGAQGGFEVLTVRTAPDVERERRAIFGRHPHPEPTFPEAEIRPNPKLHGSRKGSRLTFGSVTFEGELHVTDAALFQDTLLGGIGSGKAYGFGLLSIAPGRLA